MNSNSKLNVYSVTRGNSEWFIAHNAKAARLAAIDYHGCTEHICKAKKLSDADLQSMKLVYNDESPAGTGLDLLNHFRSRSDEIKPQLFVRDFN